MRTFGGSGSVQGHWIKLERAVWYVIESLFHVLRVVLAAFAMLVIATCLWILIGLITGTFGMQTPTVVLISAIIIAVAAFAIGGYHLLGTLLRNLCSTQQARRLPSSRSMKRSSQVEISRFLRCSYH